MTPRIVSMFSASCATLAGLALTVPEAVGNEFTVVTKQVRDFKSVFATVRSVDVVPTRAHLGRTDRELTLDEGSRVTAGQIIARVCFPKAPETRGPHGLPCRCVS
jgi:hypothetical protein